MPPLQSLAHALVSADDDASGLLTIVEQSDTLVELMHGYFTRLDTRRSQDFELIAGYIAQAKSDIRDLRPQAIVQGGFPTAGSELQAITDDTEVATNVIMTAAEAMLDMDVSDPDLKDRVDDGVMKIFEACSFQDITGQRVSKIVKVLGQIDDLISRLADAIGAVDGDEAVTERPLSAAEQRQRDLLLNGPAIGGPETRQADIDDLFATPAADDQESAAAPAQAQPNSQDDIDALFA